MKEAMAEDSIWGMAANRGELCIEGLLAAGGPGLALEPQQHGRKLRKGASRDSRNSFCRMKIPPWSPPLLSLIALASCATGCE